MNLPRFSSLFLAVLILSATPLAALTVAEVKDVVKKVDEPPKPVRMTSPKYPQALMEKRIAGSVTVLVVIDETGSVIASEVSKSSNEGFNQAALDAVTTWKFIPAKVGGEPVKSKVGIPLIFVLPPPPPPPPDGAEAQDAAGMSR